MSAKSTRCIICGNYNRSNGKVCSSCMRRLYASHEWRQALKECRALDRAIKDLQAKKKQIKRSATVIWIRRAKDE